MFEYVLVVYWNMSQPEYIGNFKSCAHATSYCEEHCTEAEYTSCLHEDYIYMPAGFVKKEIDYGKR
jgi:hypothetical protein